jgi:uncharacterized membrane protein
MDTKIRSWVKSLVWRAIGVVILGYIAYLVTGNWTDTSIITLLFHAIRTVLYYYHERVWNSIDWGRK